MKLRYLLPAAALVATQASAEVNFNGFATIAGGATLNKDEALYNYNEDLNYDNDSLFGLQVTSELDDDLSFTAQLLARGNDNWETNVEWAFISYQASENVKFQVGKQRGPYYMFTDFVDVGFAYNWVTPPTGVYDLPVGTVTGVNTIITGSAGPIDSNFQVLVGRNTGTTLLDGVKRPSDVNDLVLIAWTVNYDWLTLRASHTNAQISLEIAELQDLLGGWRQTPFANVADALEFNKDDATFSEVGFKMEFENFQLLGEMTELRSDDNFTGDQDSYYVSAAYRVDQVTFHVTYGEDETSNDYSAIDSVRAAVPVGASTSIDTLIFLSNGVLDSRLEDASYTTVGLRWDFNPSAALKIEYTDLTDNQFGADAGLVRVAISTFF